MPMDAAKRVLHVEADKRFLRLVGNCGSDFCDLDLGATSPASSVLAGANSSVDLCASGCCDYTKGELDECLCAHDGPNGALLRRLPEGAGEGTRPQGGGPRGHVALGPERRPSEEGRWACGMGVGTCDVGVSPTTRARARCSLGACDLVADVPESRTAFRFRRERPGGGKGFGEVLVLVGGARSGDKLIPDKGCDRWRGRYGRSTDENIGCTSEGADTGTNGSSLGLVGIDAFRMVAVRASCSGEAGLEVGCISVD